jgi:PAS domain S-box-containing protein
MPSRLRRIFKVPIFESEEKNRIARFLNSISWSAIFLLLIIILIRLFVGSETSAIPLLILIGIVLVLGLVQFVMRMGYVRGASIFLVLGVWAGMTYQVWDADGIRDAAAISYLVIILLASLLLSWRFGLVIGVMSVAMVWYVAVLEKNGIRATRVDDPLDYARDLTVLFLLAGTLVYLLITDLNRSLHEARLELTERLRAEEKLQRQADYLTALHETTLGLVNRLELDPLLKSILVRACELVGTSHGVVELALPDGSALRQELGHGILEQFNGSLTLRNEGLTGTVWASGKSLLVKDYSTWEGHNPSLLDLGIRSAMSVPLNSGNESIGALSLAHVDLANTFTAEQMVLLEQFAGLASIAIDNARLYEQARNEIKERHSTEIALRASEERFRKIFHASPVAICITSIEEGRLLDANDAYWKLSGFDPATSIGKTVMELELWGSLQERFDFVEKLIRTRSIHNPDYQFETVGGERKSAIAFYELVQLGEETSILSMFYDITSQKQVQEALQASEERFRKVFQSNQMAICIASLRDGKFIDANEAFWALTGMNPDFALGRTAVELGLWEGTEERAKFVENLLSNRSLKNVEYDFHVPGREVRNTVAFYELIYLDDQECVLAMFYDVTYQKKAQEALRQSEARIRALLNAFPDMIFEISNKGVFLNFIPPADTQPSVPPEEFLGKHVAEVFPTSIAAQTIFALDRSFESGQLHAFEYGLPPGEEIHFFEARVTPISEEAAMLMVRDITQRKWVETEREKLIQELEDKNAELERFTYTVSHDLKSPLITIKGFLGFLEQDAINGNITRLKSDMKRIADATDKMQTLLNELLELSRVGRLMSAPQRVSFEELAREAIELVQGRLQTQDMKVHIQTGMPEVQGDRQRLVEVVLNLVDNAAKFMGDQPDPYIVIGCREDGNPVFYVQDNGMGIPPEHHDRIFGLFNKLDASSEGTGIGLALVKRIIEVHGGRIWVESEAGKGAAFCFTLPTKPEA